MVSLNNPTNSSYPATLTKSNINTIDVSCTNINRKKGSRQKARYLRCFGRAEEMKEDFGVVRRGDRRTSA